MGVMKLVGGLASRAFHQYVPFQPSRTQGLGTQERLQRPEAGRLGPSAVPAASPREVTLAGYLVHGSIAGSVACQLLICVDK